MSINRLQHIIDGNKVAGSCGRVFDVYNPAKGEVIRQIEASLNSKNQSANRLALPPDAVVSMVITLSLTNCQGS